MSPLGIEWGAKYTLTGPDGTIAVFNDSTDPNFVGVLSPESSGLDSPEVREDAQDSTEADGGVHGDFYYGRRPVILQGTINATSATQRNERVEKLMRATNALRGDATLKWKPVGATEEVELKLRRQQPLRITKGFVKDFQAAMVSANICVESVALKEFSSKVTGLSKVPTAAVSESAGVAWTSPSNALVSDNVRATAVLKVSGEKTAYLKSTGYGFVLPAGTLPLRLLAAVEAQRSTGTALLNFAAVYAVRSGVPIEPVAYSGLNTTWSSATDVNKVAVVDVSYMTKGDVESANFGFAAQIESLNNVESTAAVDAVFAELIYTTPVEVENIGNTDADFIAIIEGYSIPNKVELVNETTGDKLVLNYTLAPGATITIDTKNRTIVHSSAGNVYSALNFAQSTWFKLAPGKNKISARQGKVTLKYKNAWL